MQRDVIAQESNITWIASLPSETATPERETNEERQLLEAQCFAELVSHIMDRLSEGHYICPLQDLHKMYEGPRRDLGINSDVNRTSCSLPKSVSGAVIWV